MHRLPSGHRQVFPAQELASSRRTQRVHPMAQLVSSGSIAVYRALLCRRRVYIYSASFCCNPRVNDLTQQSQDSPTDNEYEYQGTVYQEGITTVYIYSYSYQLVTFAMTTLLPVYYCRSTR